MNECKPLNYGCQFWAPLQAAEIPSVDKAVGGRHAAPPVGTALPVVMQHLDIEEEALPEVGPCRFPLSCPR